MGNFQQIAAATEPYCLFKLRCQFVVSFYNIIHRGNRRATGPINGRNSKIIKDQQIEANERYCIFPGIIINTLLHIDFVVSFKQHHVTGEA